MLIADHQYVTSINSDNDFPWDLKPVLFGERLAQHAYTYRRSNTKKRNNKFQGLKVLESICEKIEEEFDGEVDEVFCNRFEHCTHRIDWHKDTYGRHILVLSLGSSRRVQFRDNKTKKIDTVQPSSGDLYFFPLRVNDTHKHRVCAGSRGDGTRISLVFFFKTPSYAVDYKITKMDKLRGFWTETTGIGA